MNPRRLIIDPKVVEDLLEIGAYIAQDNVDAAHRFLVQANNTFDQLSSHPGLGTKCYFRHNRAANLRVWPIRGFENYLIFYDARDDAVVIYRVLHGARDIKSILDAAES